ncbi:MAG: substrate-binding domain-containing protein, partial [Actinobacteria bacterium]|nr:substrate-binding domain-containing protein [Actinomycetota bacterium]
MNRSKLIFLLFIVLSLVLTLAILPGCKTSTATETTAAVASTTTAAVTTASETTAAPTETTTAGSLYTYENLRKMADAGKYEGTPAKGHKIAFANIIEGIDFSSQVREPILRNWLAAGGAEEDLMLYDNNWDSATAIKVADLAIAAKPEVFIEFQIDGNVNEIIGRKARDAGVFIIAVDIPVTGFPFMGVDNYGAAVLGGKYAIEQIEKSGGIDSIDKIFVSLQGLT